jgi:hypothetical protein
MADQEIVGKLDANLLDASIFMPWCRDTAPRGYRHSIATESDFYG